MDINATAVEEIGNTVNTVSVNGDASRHSPEPNAATPVAAVTGSVNEYEPEPVFVVEPRVSS